MASEAINAGDINDQEKHRHQQQEAASDSDGDLETPNGSEFADDAVKHLHQEIEELRRDRSDRHRKMEEMLTEMERSEIGTKALSAHASELAKTAEEAENEARRLRSEMENLLRETELMKEKIDDLEVEGGRKDGEIRALKEELRVSEEKSALSALKEEEMEIDELIAESREAIFQQANLNLMASREKELTRVIEVMKEKNSELEENLVHEKDKLEKVVKELKRRNFELEAKVKELSSSKANGETIREMEIVMPAMASSSNVVSWPVTAAVAATTGAIAVATTALYLRRQR